MLKLKRRKTLAYKLVAEALDVTSDDVEHSYIEHKPFIDRALKAHPELRQIYCELDPEKFEQLFLDLLEATFMELVKSKMH